MNIAFSPSSSRSRWFFDYCHQRSREVLWLQCVRWESDVVQTYLLKAGEEDARVGRRMVLPTTDGREIRLRRITEPSAEQRFFSTSLASACRNVSTRT